MMMMMMTMIVIVRETTIMVKRTTISITMLMKIMKIEEAKGKRRWHLLKMTGTCSLLNAIFPPPTRFNILVLLTFLKIITRWIFSHIIISVFIQTSQTLPTLKARC